MMEDPAKIPQWANGKRLRADPVARVLDDDDLLMEIIVRVGFLTTLVHAAFVCRRWLSLVSDPAFLRRFRDLHPPHPLGFYVRAKADREPALFVPMLPQPPELNTAIPCASFMLDTYKGKHINLDDCQNTNVFIRYQDDARPLADTTVAHNLLRRDTGKTVFPEFPPYTLQDDMICIWRELVSKAEGDTYLYPWIEYTRGSRKCTLHVCMLQEGAWCMHTSITSTHLNRVLKTPRPLVVDNKLYMASSEYILVIDLLASTLSIVKFPQAGVVKYGMRNAMMSRADDDSGVYLIHANKLQLGIWLHKEDKWLMVDTICLREMLDNVRKSDQTFQDDHNEDVHINQVGNNDEFLLLQTGQSILYLDIKCRTLLKVYELAKCDTLQFIYPFMMTWPPTFPRLEDNLTSGAE